MCDTERDKRNDEALSFVMHNTVEVVARQMSRDMENIFELKQSRDELLAALKECKSDLFYQISSKHGPQAASMYPSILQANEAITKCDA